MPCWAWLRRKAIVIKRDLPAAIGVGDEITAKALAAGYGADEVKAALKMHFNSKKYFAAAASGSHRYDINGNPTVSLTDDERAWFKQRLERRLRQQNAKAAGSQTGTPT
jgi:sRNA-binding protein